MSSSTLPKSIQAQIGASNDRLDENILSQERIQQIRDFARRYKHLPEDFLRLPNDPDRFELENMSSQSPGRMPLIDMIEISVVEAQLVKNYGLLRMDLYCKIRVGHLVCETQTCPNGAKNPKWDGVYQFNLKPGIDSFHLEIYDEKQFSQDEKIAWLHEVIPPEVFRGVTIERWFPLSGRLGQNKEGSILLVLSHKRIPSRPSNLGHGPNLTYPQPVPIFLPNANQGQIIGGPAMIPFDPQIPTYVHPMPPPGPTPSQANDRVLTGTNPEAQPQTVRPVSDDDINQLSEMFPSISKVVIKSVLENHYNDKEAAISSLLALG